MIVKKPWEAEVDTKVDTIQLVKSILGETFPRIEMNSTAENHLCRNISSNRDELRGRKSSLQKHFLERG